MVNFKKECCFCHKYKTLDNFEDRGDAWGQYSGCNDCRKHYGRDKCEPEQQEYMNKTDIFNLK